MTDAIIMDYLKIARERGSRPGVGPGCWRGEAQDKIYKFF